MTKRKTTTKQAPQASTATLESVKQESNTTVTTKSKQANSTTKKASTGGRRGRPKKVKQLEGTIESQDIKITISPPAPIQKVVDVDSRTITYVGKDRAIILADKPASMYERFVNWLFRITYYFRQ